MSSLICAWINGWVNNREAGDLGCHRAHCDVILMIWSVYKLRFGYSKFCSLMMHNMKMLCERFRWILLFYTKTITFNTLRPRRNERHFADDIFKRIFFNENVWISIKISLKFVPKGPINNIPALVQIMTWRRSGDKPLSEPMMVSLPTHICVIRPQWVKSREFSCLFNHHSRIALLRNQLVGAMERSQDLITSYQIIIAVPFTNTSVSMKLIPGYSPMVLGFWVTLRRHS